MTWWDTLKNELYSRLVPNDSPYAGQQPIGRNIWGNADVVDTHFPNTNPISVSPSTAWLDRNGENALSIADWDVIVNQLQDLKELNSLEQRLRDTGFFHVSELPPNMRKAVNTDTQIGRATPDIEAALLPPHLHYEPVPDETYSLEYDNGEHYLPPYNPNATPQTGNPIPIDYYGEMPPIGDTGGEDQLAFDDYLGYMPPVQESKKLPYPFGGVDISPLPIVPEEYYDWEYAPTANIPQQRRYS